MPTINQLVRLGREVAKKKSASPALTSCPAEKGCLREGLHDNSQEAELGFAKSCPCEADERHGSDHVHTGIGHNLQEHSVVSYQGRKGERPYRR